MDTSLLELEQRNQFGQYIYRRRKALGINQAQLAALLNAEGLRATYSYISKIEKGKTTHPPSEAFIRGLATILGEDTEEMLRLAGKFDRRALQGVIVDRPEAVALLRRLQTGQVSNEQLAAASNEATEEATELTRQTIMLLATGLLRQDEAIQARTAAPVTMLDPQLQRGWDRLALLCIQHGGVMPPRHITDLVRWLHSPVEQWEGVGYIFRAAGHYGPLLVGGIPSELCLRIGQSLVGAHDMDIEMQDAAFREILDHCKKNNLVDQYTVARRFLVEFPFLPEGAIIAVHTNPEVASLDDVIVSMIKRCYEHVPPSCKRERDGQTCVARCGRCGWPIELRDDKPHCYSTLCASLERGRYLSNPIWEPLAPEAMRTKKGIQFSVTGPEKPLIALYYDLTERLALQCDLWPELDVCDLGIHFPGGELWAVDMKDYENPIRLAQTLSRDFRRPPGYAWNRAFYVFPEHRSLTPAYRKAFLAYWARTPDVEEMYVQEFIAEVERKLAALT